MSRKTKRNTWILAGFLIFMIICTVLSRAAASVLVAQVSVEKPGRGKLSFSCGGEGTVVPFQETPIFLWAGQQVEWAAEAGSTVKAGECLVQFRMEYLGQSIQSKQAELTQLELQMQQQQIAARGTVRVPSAERAQQALAEAQNQLQAAQQKEAEAQAAYNATAGGFSEANPSGFFEESPGIPSEAAADSGSARRQELEAALQAARENVDSARQALSLAQTDYDFARKEDAAQNANESNAAQSARLGVQSLNVQVETARQALEQLISYQNAGGKICAEQDCTVLTSGIQAGTFSTGAEVMVTGSGGWQLKGMADAKDKERLKAGVEAEIRLGAGKKKTVRIESIAAERSPDGGAGESGGASSALRFCWYTRLPENTTAENGNSFTWTVNADSDKEYEQVIPLGALREDTAGAYCLILSEEKTMLGTVQTARRVPVTVLEKDSQKAAITSTLKDTDQVIVSSEKYVEEGDRVRIKK